MTTASEKLWFLVQCKPKQDLRAFENLQRQGYECLMPLHRVVQLKKGKLVAKEEPLFPGYVFIELDSVQDNWMPIRSTRGVSQIVRFNSTPLSVPSIVIKNIRLKDIHTTVKLIPGDTVEINHIGCQGLDAVFMEMDGTERVILLLNLLHRESYISVPITKL